MSDFQSLFNNVTGIVWISITLLKNVPGNVRTSTITSQERAIIFSVITAPTME